MVGEALKDSLSKYELDNRIQREEASTARAQVHKLKCDMMMKGLELSRNALKDELRCERNNNVDLRQKLNAKLTETIELESELVPERVKITELEGALEANKAQVAKLEAKSTEVEAKKDRKAEELSKSSAELAQMHEENSGPKKKIEELDLSAAHVPLQVLVLLWSRLPANILTSTSPNSLFTMKWWMARSCLQLNCFHLPLQSYHLENFCI